MKSTIFIDDVSFDLDSNKISIGDLLKLAGKEGDNQSLAKTYKLFRVFEGGEGEQKDLLFGGGKPADISEILPVESNMKFIVEVSDDAEMQASQYQQSYDARN